MTHGSPDHQVFGVFSLEVLILMFCCRRAVKNPAGFDKRAKMSAELNGDSEEDSPAGKTLVLLLTLMFDLLHLG